MTYYDDLINDNKRVESFKKAINRLSHGVVYDLGTGSGILAQFASNNAIKVFAIEQNPFILKHTKENFSENKNIKLIETDATQYVFTEKPDVIICEMLDTALIDEEQVPVINNAHKYITDSTIFIPKAVYTTVQLISTNINHITYYEDNLPKYESLSDELKYQRVNFSELINETVEKNIKITTTNSGKINAIKLTTYTIITDDIILEPTPMLNPPLLIPVDEIDVTAGEKIIININYVMGGGLNNIQANIRRLK